MELCKSPRFISEYDEFKRQIELIENAQGKEHCEKLLQKLLFAVRTLDQKHMDLTQQFKMPDSGLGDARGNITEIRRQIVTTIKNYKSN